MNHRRNGFEGARGGCNASGLGPLASRLSWVDDRKQLVFIASDIRVLC